MSYYITFRPKALAEIQESYDYYEDIVDSLGKQFVEALELELNNIVQYPKQAKTVRKEFRQALIKKFPFVIIYKIIDTNIIVYSVFHTSRNPKDKFKR